MQVKRPIYWPQMARRPDTALDLLAADERRSVVAAGMRAIEKRSASSIKEPTEQFLNVFGGRSASGANVSEGTAYNISTVFACVRVLAESIATLPLKLYKKTADGREEATDHPLYNLLKEEPNESQTSFEWREMMSGHVALRGNAYSLIKRDTYFDVVALEPIHPGEVYPQKLKNGAIVYGYQGRNYYAHEMLHLRGLSSDGIAGLSPLRIMRESIGLALTMQEHGAKSFANGNRFPGILKSAAVLQPNQVKALREAWDSQRSGENATKVPIVHSGLDWMTVGMTNQDAEFVASAEFQRKDIAEAFRVPLVMLAHGDKAATYASVEQFMLTFVNQTLQPWITRWEQRLNVSLLSAQDRAAGYYFSFNLKALMRGDAKSRAEYYRTMREIRAIKINEIREAEEMNNFPDNIGDNPREDFNGQGGKAPAKSEPATEEANT